MTSNIAVFLGGDEIDGTTKSNDGAGWGGVEDVAFMKTELNGSVPLGPANPFLAFRVWFVYNNDLRPGFFSNLASRSTACDGSSQDELDDVSIFPLQPFFGEVIVPKPRPGPRFIKQCRNLRQILFSFFKLMKETNVCSSSYSYSYWADSHKYINFYCFNLHKYKEALKTGVRYEIALWNEALISEVMGLPELLKIGAIRCAFVHLTRLFFQTFA